MTAPVKGPALDRFRLLAKVGSPPDVFGKRPC